MVTIKTFVFNPFQVNTYLLVNERNEGLLIDAANYTKEEDAVLTEYLGKYNIKLTHHLLTHAHVDHILGAAYLEKQFGLLPVTHSKSLMFLESAKEYGSVFGLQVQPVTNPVSFLDDGEDFLFGNIEIKALHCPGHADGSLCYYLKNENILFSGDVLFAESIGRTDLPTGNMNVLLSSIREKLFVLPEETKVYPGHGEPTTIGHEQKHNPFL